jgi:hypothetical protein
MTRPLPPSHPHHADSAVATPSRLVHRIRDDAEAQAARKLAED